MADGAGKAVPCPECDLQAEVTDRFTLDGTDGPVAHVAVACPAGHYFRMAVDRLSANARERLVELGSNQATGGRWRSGETMREAFQDDDAWSESDGVRVRSAVACLAASKISLRAAEYLVWQQPCECAPRRVPALIDGASGVLSTTASIVACLAVTDLNALRRDQFRQISSRMSELLVDLQELSRSDT